MVNPVHLVTKMTSASAPSPFAVASSGDLATAYANFQAFDGNQFAYPNSTWLGSAASSWISIDLGAGNTFPALSQYSIQPPVTFGSGYFPTGWTFAGSNDNSTWTTIDAKSAQTLASATNYFSVSPGVAYRYYRWSMSNSGSSVGADELGLYYVPSANGGTPLIGEGLVY